MATTALDLTEQAWHAIESGDLDALDGLFSPEAEMSTSSASGRGLDYVKGVFARHREAYPDLQHEVVSCIAGDGGDAIALQLRFAGTHRGALRHPDGRTIPPTGRRIAWQSSDEVHAVDGRIVSWHASFDRLALLLQVTGDGARPVSDPASAAPAPEAGLADSVGGVLDDMVQRVAAEPARAAGLSATYLFRLDGADGGDRRLVFVDGSATRDDASAAAPDATIAMTADDFVAMHTGALDGSTAFATGRMRVAGDVALAMRLGELFRSPEQPRAVTPEPITRVASGFMASKHLFTAAEIGVFEHLADGPADLETLAVRLGVPARTVRIVVDALVGLELLARDGTGRYENSPSTNAFLTGRSPVDLRPFLRFWNRISYPRWAHLEAAVRADDGVPFPLDDTQQAVMSEGIAAVTSGGARALSGAYPFERHGRLLDVGGGTGSFLTAVLDHRPVLRGTLLEVPEVVAVAREQLVGHPAADRIDVVAGDVFTDPIPPGHDLVLAANVLHIFRPERNLALLRRVRAGSAPGTRLLLVDTWTGEDRSTPLQAALTAGEYLLVNGGDVYGVADVRAWLDDTGWAFVEHRPLIGPGSLIVAEAAA